MDYPLLLGGERAGTLRVDQQGLYTCMEVSAEVREGLLRVWVQGGGREAYLGILQPGEGGMTLRRRLSRREMAAFPPAIEQASDRRLKPEKEVDITTETAAPEANAALPAPDPVLPGTGPEPETKPDPEPDPVLPGTGPEPETKPDPEPETKPDPEPGTKSEPEPGTGPEAESGPQSGCAPGMPALIWRERRDGSLVAAEGTHILLALPAKLRRPPPGGDLRRIGGREYLVFRY